MRKNNNTNKNNGNVYEMIGQIVVATTVRMVAGYAIGAAINKLEKAYKEKKALKANDATHSELEKEKKALMNNNADPSELDKESANCKNVTSLSDMCGSDTEGGVGITIPDVLKHWDPYAEEDDENVPIAEETASKYHLRFTKEQVIEMCEFVRENCIGMRTGDAIKMLKKEFKHDADYKAYYRFINGITYKKISKYYFTCDENTNSIVAVETANEPMSLEEISFEDNIVNGVKIVEEFPWINNPLEPGYDILNSIENTLDKYRKNINNGDIPYMVKSFAYSDKRNSNRVYIDIYGQLLDENMVPLENFDLLGVGVSRKFKKSRKLFLYAVLRNCVANRIKDLHMATITDYKELGNTNIIDIGFIRKFTKATVNERLTVDEVTAISEFVKEYCVGSTIAETIRVIQSVFKYNVTEAALRTLISGINYTDTTSKYFKYNHKTKRIEEV